LIAGAEGAAWDSGAAEDGVPELLRTLTLFLPVLVALEELDLPATSILSTKSATPSNLLKNVLKPSLSISVLSPQEMPPLPQLRTALRPLVTTLMTLQARVRPLAALV